MRNRDTTRECVLDEQSREILKLKESLATLTGKVEDYRYQVDSLSSMVRTYEDELRDLKRLKEEGDRTITALQTKLEVQQADVEEQMLFRQEIFYVCDKFAHTAGNVRLHARIWIRCC
jgi:chromosome segregation ATPase